MQSIGVAVLATILSSAITVSMPANVSASGDITKLPPAVQATIHQAIQVFQNQYITGLQHAYLATCVIAIVATILSLFLPGWPAKYMPASQRNAVPESEAQPSGVA